MLSRLLLIIITIVVIFASTRRADAADTSLMFKSVPVAPDKGKPRNLVDSVERWLLSGPEVSRSGKGDAMMIAKEKDMSTSLGVVHPKMNMTGASIAGVGAAAWLATIGWRSKSGITIAPRVFGGGGGLGVSFRW